MTNETNISDAEWVVMEAVWSLGGGTAAAIIETLADSTNWNHRTIRTLLRRLVDKEFLEQQKLNNGSVYHPLVPRRSRVKKESKSFLQRVFLGDTNSLLLHFAKEGKLGAEKLARLRDLLDDETSEKGK